MKRALLVGIDHYQYFTNLAGCVNDARALLPLLARNEDDSPNLESRILISGPNTAVTREHLLRNLDQLFAPGSDFALLYFAGHGKAENNDVTLITSDGNESMMGVRFFEVLEKIKKSNIKEVIVILDCCFSGAAGGVPLLTANMATLPNGVSILTASRDDQTSAETPLGRGKFSTYFEGGLEGGAADVLGHVTVAGLYSYLSESFGAWEQRPTFKANIDRLTDVRVCKASVPLPTLRMLTTWFPTPDYAFPLDPSYEPDADPDHPEHEKIFGQLQKCRAAKLVEPVGSEHMYYAAMDSLSCRLTPLGKHYWSMVEAGKI